jgi:hypothetical protein
MMVGGKCCGCASALASHWQGLEASCLQRVEEGGSSNIDVAEIVEHQLVQLEWSYRPAAVCLAGSCCGSLLEPQVCS